MWKFDLVQAQALLDDSRASLQQMKAPRSEEAVSSRAARAAPKHPKSVTAGTSEGLGKGGQLELQHELFNNLQHLSDSLTLRTSQRSLLPPQPQAWQESTKQQMPAVPQEATTLVREEIAAMGSRAVELQDLMFAIWNHMES